jgi:hypothetical protein
MKEYFYFSCLTTVLAATYFYAQKTRMREQLEYLDLQNGILEQGYRKAYDFYAENAKLYHDMHHHLRAVEQMVTRGEDAEALKYIAGVQEPVRTAAVPVYTGMELVDTTGSGNDTGAKKSVSGGLPDWKKYSQTRRKTCRTTARQTDRKIRRSITKQSYRRTHRTVTT